MKKLLSAIVLVIILLSLAPLHQSFALNWVDQDYAQGLFEALTKDAVNSPAYASHMNTNYMSDTVRKILGPVRGITITDDMIRRNPEYVQQLAQGSAVAGISNYIAAIYDNPPASTTIAIRDFGQALGFLPKQAYAQGVGFSGLSALLNVWKVFRNISYLLLAIAIVIIGFMVMFRKKIDPKTVVTVQNSLPRVITTLLLITFSYAIVAFMIDLMYLSIALTVGIFDTQGILPPPDTQNVTLIFPGPGDRYSTNQALYSQGGLFAVLQNAFRNPPFLSLDPSADTSINALVYKALGLNSNAARLVQGAGFVGGFLITAAGVPLLGVPLLAAGALPTIIGLIVAIAMLFLIIRLFAFYVGAYIQIVISLIFGPIQILAEAIPGSNAFSSWFRNLVANLVVFPIGAVIFMLSAIFARFSTGTGDPLWIPPYTPFFSSSETAITALLSIGILFALPSIAGSMREALKAKPLISAGPEGVVGAVSQPVGLGMQLYQLWVARQSMEAFRGIAKISRSKSPESGQ